MFHPTKRIWRDPAVPAKCFFLIVLACFILFYAYLFLSSDSFVLLPDLSQ